MVERGPGDPQQSVEPVVPAQPVAPAETPATPAVDPAAEATPPADDSAVADPDVIVQPTPVAPVPEAAPPLPPEIAQAQAEAQARETRETERTEKNKKLKLLDDAIKKTARLAEQDKLKCENKFRKKSTADGLWDFAKRFGAKAAVGAGAGLLFGGVVGMAAGAAGAVGSEIGIHLVKLAKMGVNALERRKAEDHKTKEEVMRETLEEIMNDRYDEFGKLALAAKAALELPADFPNQKVEYGDGEYTADELRLMFLEFVTKMSDPKSDENKAIADKETEYNSTNVGWKLAEVAASLIGGIMSGHAAADSMRAALAQSISRSGVHMQGGGLGELMKYGSEKLHHLQGLGHDVHLYNNQMVFDYNQAELPEIAKALNHAPAWLRDSFSVIDGKMHLANNISLTDFNNALREAVNHRVAGLALLAGGTSLIGDVIGSYQRFDGLGMREASRYKDILAKKDKLKEVINPQAANAASSGGGTDSDADPEGGDPAPTGPEQPGPAPAEQAEPTAQPAETPEVIKTLHKELKGKTRKLKVDKDSGEVTLRYPDQEDGVKYVFKVNKDVCNTFDDEADYLITKIVGADEDDKMIITLIPQTLDEERYSREGLFGSGKNSETHLTKFSKKAGELFNEGKKALVRFRDGKVWTFDGEDQNSGNVLYKFSLLEGGSKQEKKVSKTEMTEDAVDWYTEKKVKETAGQVEYLDRTSKIAKLPKDRYELQSIFHTDSMGNVDPKDQEDFIQKSQALINAGKKIAFRFFVPQQVWQYVGCTGSGDAREFQFTYQGGTKTTGPKLPNGSIDWYVEKKADDEKKDADTDEALKATAEEVEEKTLEEFVEELVSLGAVKAHLYLDEPNSTPQLEFDGEASDKLFQLRTSDAGRPFIFDCPDMLPNKDAYLKFSGRVETEQTADGQRLRFYLEPAERSNKGQNAQIEIPVGNGVIKVGSKIEYNGNKLEVVRINVKKDGTFSYFYRDENGGEVESNSATAAQWQESYARANQEGQLKFIKG